MKNLITVAIFLMSLFQSQAQQKVTINLTTTNADDIVYITGNQPSLGDWEPKKVMMQKISDFERSITLELTLPAEFKFTRGSWDSEAVFRQLSDTDNIIIDDPKITIYNYRIKGWSDNLTAEESALDYRIERLKSKFFADERLVKVYLPEHYSPTKHYPVLYLLDGYPLFDIAASYVKQLSRMTDYDTDAVPQCIVVGIFHQNRHYETNPDFKTIKLPEGSQKLMDFVKQELVPYVNGEYAVSGYNMIAGHSNTAYTVMNLLFQDDNTFKGIMAFSLNGESDFVRDNIYKALQTSSVQSVFLGYGLKDIGFRENGMYLEKAQQSGQLQNDHFAVHPFNATHNQMPGTAMPDGIRFLFKDYRNFKDFEALAGQKDFDVTTYFASYIAKMKSEYGITVGITEEDFGYILETAVLLKNKNIFDQLTAYYATTHPEPYHTHLLFYFNREIGDIESARKYAYEMLTKESQNDRMILLGNIEKYISLFRDDFKSASEAISFLEKCAVRFPEYKPELEYFIAKTAIEAGIEKGKAKKSLAYCYKNCEGRKYFTKVDLDNLKKGL